MENPNDENPEPGSESSNSLQDLINRAKRAHELVDAVDLKKVAKHDGAEMAKVSTISEALTDLEAGQMVAHVEGIDEVIIEINEHQQQRAELIALVDSFGWADRINRVLHRINGVQELKPLELIQHTEGLPEFEMCVAPEVAATDGGYGLFVTMSGVYAGTINTPTNKHHWRIVRSRPYDNADELQANLSKFITTAFE